MSRIRQKDLERRPDWVGGHAVVPLAADFPDGHFSLPHVHDRDQLLYATRGVMEVTTPSGAWIVPAHRAVWIPAVVSHAVRMHGDVRMTSLYLRPEPAGGLPRTCCVVNVSPLLREMILHMVARGVMDPAVPADARLVAVLGDLLESLRVAPVHLPMPADPAARRVADRMREDPSESRPLAELAAEVGMSARTLERRFHDETGMPFRDWRRQARLVHALALLAQGHSVTAVALELGYSTSAFVSMFRGMTGVSPGRYFEAPGNAG